MPIPCVNRLDKMVLVKKAVLPVAGLGTRFSPVTTVLPKEMLPVVDKPLIDYAIDEAEASGITELIFVVSEKKRLIVEHLITTKNLRPICREEGEESEPKFFESMSSPGVKVSFVMQAEPLGLGHAILCAKNLVGDDFFAVILPDDLIMSGVPCLAQMLISQKERGGNFIGIVEVDPDQTHLYGVLEVKNVDSGPLQVEGMVEKPEPGRAPSNFAIIGRYVLHPKIFQVLEKQLAGVNGEIQLTEAMQTMLSNQSFYGFRFEGNRFDCGDKVGLLEANIAYSLKRKNLRRRVEQVVRNLMAEDLTDRVDT